MSGTGRSADGREARPIRVSLVGPSLDILGGQAVQARRLTLALGASPSLRVTFIPVNPRLPGPLAHLQRIKYVRTLATTIAYVARLARLIPRQDVIHVFSAAYFSFAIAALPALVIGRLAGCGVALNYRSGEADDHLRRWRWLLRWALRLPQLIIVPSAYLVDVFRRAGYAAIAIPNFVDLDAFTYRVRRRARPVFLSTRNLEPLYNIPCILRAFAVIQRAEPTARLLVAGAGNERGALEALARDLGLRNVEFLGAVSPARIPALHDQADVYLNAPDIDNMPNTLIEAFAAGLPIVTTDAGGIPFMVDDGQTALMVPRGDHEALAAAALRVVREPGLAERLSRAGRAACEARYVWSATGPLWEDAYARLALRRGTAGRVPADRASVQLSVEGKA